MSDSQIRCQQVMASPEFRARFGTEAQCTEADRRARWPDGFRYPWCSGGEHPAVGHDAGKVFHCKDCWHQASSTAGSPLEHTKLPLTAWFLAIHLFSQCKTGLSALAPRRQQGVSRPTALLLCQKTDRATVQRHDTAQLSSARQFDHAGVGGVRAGGKAGRGAENKVPVVAGVSPSDKGHPLDPKVDLVSGFALQAIRKWAFAPFGAERLCEQRGRRLRRASHQRRPHPRASCRGRRQDPGTAPVQMGQQRPAESRDDTGGRRPLAELPQIIRAVPLRFRQPAQPLPRSALAIEKLIPRCSADRLEVERSTRVFRGNDSFAVQRQNPGGRDQIAT